MQVGGAPGVRESGHPGNQGGSEGGIIKGGQGGEK